MATAMTAGAAATGMRAWVAAHKPAWATDRGLKLFTATILAAGVLASGSHLAPNGAAQAASAARPPSPPAGAVAEAPAAGASAIFDPAILLALTAAKASGALEAIEGSLVYLGAQYVSEEKRKAAAEAPPPRPSSVEEEGVGDASPLPPASAGTNGTPIPPPPGIAGSVVAQAPEPAGDAAGATATFVSGIALAPPEAPERVAGVINAANTIVGRPYIWGGGHGSWFSRGYDCSGAVSFALAGGGFIPRPLTSGELESWGAPGPGRWLTVYASASHAYAVIAGLRWDTVGDARGTGPRWHLAGAAPDGFVVRHPPGY
jgi:cell wall-associated NlpC family hydrolase